MREIEAKARVGYFQLDRVFSFFNARFGKSKIVTKVDTYYRKGDGNNEFRIRRIGDSYWLNEKTRTVEDGVEINFEKEREITGEEAKRIDKESSVFAIKTKREYVWTGDFEGNRFSFELVNVVDLGIFLEIEILLDDDASDSLAEAAKACVLGYFKELGLSQRLESRKYLDMLFG